MPRDRSTNRRPASQDEIRALASATRLRILRLTLDAPLTNRQLAERLGISPASAHYHVRRLLDVGLLEAQDAQPRTAGGVEIPYRSHGHSWRLDIADEQRPNAAMLEAFLAELDQVGKDRLEHAVRMRVRLSDARRAELMRRLREVLDTFADDDADGIPASVFVAVHPDPSAG